MLNTTTITLNEEWKPHEFFKNTGNGYAILSHRWQDAEISFQQMRQGVPRTSPQLKKIVNACEVAKSLGHDWLWVDTCCINKESQTELVESINSMFQWYLEAAVCLGYLYDVESGGASGRDDASQPGIFRKTGTSSENWQASEWFSRGMYAQFPHINHVPILTRSQGWTLQELLAPRNMLFFDMHWNPLGSKSDLAPKISAVTGIDIKYLRKDRESLSSACIATKMSWMSRRRTTREEDMAYSLIGLFNINMDVRYGKTGTSAFVRLQEELLKKAADESLFAWRMPKQGSNGYAPAGWASDEWGLFAAEPSWFEHSGRLTIQPNRQAGKKMLSRPVDNGFAAVQHGVRCPSGLVQLKRRVVLPALPTIIGVWILVGYLQARNSNISLIDLNCWSIDTHEQIALHVVHAGGDGKLKRSRCTEFASASTYHVTKPAEGQAHALTRSPRVVLQPEERYD